MPFHLNLLSCLVIIVVAICDIDFKSVTDYGPRTFDLKKGYFTDRIERPTILISLAMHVKNIHMECI